jgi:hypothetical protein
MTAGNSPAAAAEALRQAVIEGRYADAERWLVEYARAVAQLRNPKAAEEACGLIEWARKLTLSRRKAAAASLAALPALARGYVRTGIERTQSWVIVG